MEPLLRPFDDRHDLAQFSCTSQAIALVLIMYTLPLTLLSVHTFPYTYIPFSYVSLANTYSIYFLSILPFSAHGDLACAVH